MSRRFDDAPTLAHDYPYYVIVWFVSGEMISLLNFEDCSLASIDCFRHAVQLLSFSV